MGRYTVIDNNIIDKQGILNIIKNFIFGTASVEIYDQNKTYNSGDKAFVIDALSGDIKVVTAIENGITGTYNPEKWNDMTLADTIGTGLDDVIVISESEPTARMAQIWLTPNEYSTHYINAPNSSVDPDVPPIDPNVRGRVMLFTNSAVPIVEDTTTANLTHLDIGDIVFDWEGENTLSIEGLTDIYNDETIIVDEQDDIVVDDDNPGSSHYSSVWFDTDLTDDSL